jgi:hypothetical protein
MGTPAVISGDIDALAPAVLARRAGDAPCLIAIGGANGSGKIHLARRLGRALNLYRIQIDDFLSQPKKDLYCDSLDLTRLEGEIAGRRARAETAIVEGVCVLEILRHICHDPHLLIYIKPILKSGGHAYPKFCGEDATRRELCELAAIRKSKPPNLIMQVLEYPRRHDPCTRADIIFEVVVERPPGRAY